MELRDESPAVVPTLHSNSVSHHCRWRLVWRRGGTEKEKEGEKEMLSSCGSDQSIKQTTILSEMWAGTTPRERLERERETVEMEMAASSPRMWGMAVCGTGIATSSGSYVN